MYCEICKNKKDEKYNYCSFCGWEFEYYLESITIKEIEEREKQNEIKREIYRKATTRCIEQIDNLWEESKKVNKYLEEAKKTDDLHQKRALYQIALIKGYFDQEFLYNNIGLTFADSGENDVAIEYYHKVLSLNSNNSASLNNLGNIYIKQEKLNEALNHFNRAKEIKETSEIYNNIGIVLNIQQHYKKAIKNYKKAINLEKNLDKAFNNMGISYKNLKDYDKAIESYIEAIKINPKNNEAYNNLGNIYSFQKDYDRAIEYYHKSLKINSSNDNTLNNIGVAYEGKKNYRKAKEFYKKALDINPLHINAHNNLKEINQIKERS